MLRFIFNNKLHLNIQVNSAFKVSSLYVILRSFAPVWDVFKSSTEKLASCHLELVRKLQELIKEVHKYGDEQIKAHKKVNLFNMMKLLQMRILDERFLICM